MPNRNLIWLCKTKLNWGTGGRPELQAQRGADQKARSFLIGFFDDRSNDWNVF